MIGIIEGTVTKLLPHGFRIATAAGGEMDIATSTTGRELAIAIGDTVSVSGGPSTDGSTWLSSQILRKSRGGEMSVVPDAPRPGGLARALAAALAVPGRLSATARTLRCPADFHAIAEMRYVQQIGTRPSTRVRQSTHIPRDGECRIEIAHSDGRDDVVAPFTVPKSDVARLYARLSDAGMFTLDWPPVANVAAYGDDWPRIVVLAAGRTYRVPRWVAAHRESASATIGGAITALVPQSAWDTLNGLMPT
ncbi:MAG: hypothetical protein ABJD07_10500 [Gemmatimonadaceae bacterium]